MIELLDPETPDAAVTTRRSVFPSLVSLNIHLLLLVILALVLFNPEREEEPLVLEMQNTPENEDTSFAVFEMTKSEPSVASESVESEPSIVTIDEVVGEVEPVAFGPPGDAVASIGDAMEAMSFDQRLDDARRYGIDIVIVFDATGSMSSEINSVKQNIQAITQTVLRKIPKARFSLAYYRDFSDVVRVGGVPLNNNLTRISKFAKAIGAQGGGRDAPEAVNLGMKWAVAKNEFRQSSQHVMLIFGDAPPHQHVMKECLGISERFGRSRKGIVHTVTCKKSYPLPEFVEIAGVGGGHAYTMRNTQSLLEELLVLTFGHQHRREIIDFFGLRLKKEMARARKK